MPVPIVITGERDEATDMTFVARIAGTDNSILVSSDFTTYDLSVFDIQGETPTTAVYSVSGVSVTAGSPIFDTLQTDGYWTKDATGYNFRHTITTANITTQGGHAYRVEYRFSTSAWGVIPGNFRPTIVEAWSA